MVSEVPLVEKQQHGYYYSKPVDGRMSLYVEPPSGKKKTIKIPKKPTTIGRSNSCTIKIEDPHISRSHSRITVEINVPYIVDLGSKHTRVNGEKITKCPLKPGDVIKIGKTNMTFQVKGNIFRQMDSNHNSSNEADDLSGEALIQM